MFKTGLINTEDILYIGFPKENCHESEYLSLEAAVLSALQLEYRNYSEEYYRIEMKLSLRHLIFLKNIQLIVRMIILKKWLYLQLMMRVQVILFHKELLLLHPADCFLINLCIHL